jgi:hypothetical protein
MMVGIYPIQAIFASFDKPSPDLAKRVRLNIRSTLKTGLSLRNACRPFRPLRSFDRLRSRANGRRSVRMNSDEGFRREGKKRSNEWRNVPLLLIVKAEIER